MSTPMPRPALRRAADAHVSPAVPIAATDSTSSDSTSSTKNSKDGKANSGQGAKKGKKRKSELNVKLPKGLRAQFDERVKQEGYEADDVVAMLIQAWLNR